jgi:hypothetical protein
MLLLLLLGDDAITCYNMWHEYDGADAHVHARTCLLSQVSTVISCWLPYPYNCALPLDKSHSN